MILDILATIVFIVMILGLPWIVTMELLERASSEPPRDRTIVTYECACGYSGESWGHDEDGFPVRVYKKVCSHCMTPYNVRRVTTFKS